MEEDKVIEEIRKELYEGKMYCFVGAGLSAQAGVPTWKDLLERMGKQLQGFSLTFYKQFNELRNANRLLEAGQVWKDARIFENEKQSLISSVFLEGKGPKSVHLKLIRASFRGIFTTNYDHLIEDAYATVKGCSLRPVDLERLSRGALELSGQFFAAKLHGDASDWHSIVLARDDYIDVTWPDKIKDYLRDQALLVIGFGGSCPMVNQFLQAIPNTHVFLVMSPKEIRAYEEFLGRIDPIAVPKNVRLVGVEHDDLEGFLAEIRPSVPPHKVMDSPWGKMPPRPVRLAFEEANNDIRDFLFSDRKVACLIGRPGSGLSSFLAGVLEEFSERDDYLVFRLEGKEWLFLDAYVLHILAHLPDEGKMYDKLRREEAGGWTDECEARALAASFSKLGMRVIVGFEHADRLSERSLDFWRRVVDEASSDFKLIVTGPTLVEVSRNVARIEFRSASRDARVQLCAHHVGDEKLASELVDSLRTADLNALVLAACLVAQKVLSLEQIQGTTHNTETLCRAAIQSLGEMPSGLECVKVLKTCAIFRTPRTLSSLLASCQLSNESGIEKHVKQISRYGLLIPGSSGREAEYAMSSSIRSKLDELLSWEEGEREAMASPIARYFKSGSIEKLDPGHYTRTDVIRGVPLISCALYHYAESGNRAAYIDLVGKARVHLQYMYHFRILEEWLDAKAIPREAGELQANLDYEIAYTKARISRIRSLTGEYESHLSDARKAIIQMKQEQIECARQQDAFRFEEGILLTMKRRYPQALKRFLDCFRRSPRDWPDSKLRSLERIVQTLLSLGRLKDAQSYLNKLKARLNEIESSNPDWSRIGHHWAMHHRHRSTLATLRILLFDCRPENMKITKAELLKQALEESAACEKRSKEAGYSHSRLTLYDMSGIGIAALKEA